jgi:serine protease AprX
LAVATAVRYDSSNVTAIRLSAVAALLMLALGSGSPGAATSFKVDRRVLADIATGRNAYFLVVLGRQADAQAAAAEAPDRSAAGRAVFRSLRHAAASQAPVLRVLRRLHVRYRSYWIVNAIAVEGGMRAVDALAALPQIRSIQPDRAFRGSLGTRAAPAAHAHTALEWNISKINAPGVWRLGVTGQRIVYANADTGVVWNHPALRSHYRGWNGTRATHDYNWWDAVHDDIDGDHGNSCGFSIKAPCDDADSSHGTHTMGTAVGDDHAGNRIGVAPGAKWIACRNMDEGTGRPSTYIECLQFFLAPTDLNGQNPRPDRRPNIVGNSYSCVPSEGCSIGALQTAVDNLRAAGVFVAVAAGNDGPSCSSLTFPPAPYASAVAVGSTDGNDVIVPSSSRGPVTADGSGRRKPDLVAPGDQVRSSVRGGYALLSGTSIATPHVGGAVALLWSAFPSLRGRVDRTEQLLEQTAKHLTTTDGCGGDSPTQVPNNTYGYGRIDVLAAFRAADRAAAPTVTRLSVNGRTVRVVLSERASVRFSVMRGRRAIVRLSRVLLGGAASVRLPAHLPPGSYVLTAVARDSVGKLGKPARRRFRIRA